MTGDDWHTPTLDDALAAAAAGIDAATERSGPEWQTYAIDFVRDYLEQHPTLFCDDVWSAGLDRPASPRAFGNVMRQAIARGWMTLANEPPRRSTQSNGSWRPVYSSCIHLGDGTAS